MSCTSESKEGNANKTTQINTAFSRELIDQQVYNLMDSANIPGLALGVIQQGKIVYTKGYGLLKSDSTAKVDEHTVFDAASLSKPVFGYAVFKLMEEGKLSLDTPLYTYLPYPDIAYDDRYKKITARMVLSHTTGFPNWRGGDKLKIQFTPGEKFSYSGEGFVYLQRVVEKITGKPLNEVMQEKVFTPLGMKCSSYIWQKDFDTNFAFPHSNFGHPFEKNKSDHANAAYSLQTTAQDYATFLLAIIHHTGISDSTVQQMLTRQIAVPVADSANAPLSTEVGWGLGFGLEQTEAGNVFWHWGDNGTYKCYVAVDKEAGNGMIYFTNSFNGLGIMQEMVQQVIPGKHPAVDFLDYDWYKAPNSLFARDIPSKGVAAAIAPFLDEKGNSTIEEEQMNWIGNQLLNRGKVKEAIEVFELNLKAYPASANTYADYAIALLRNGDREKAISTLNKSLQIKADNFKVKQMLAGLEKSQRKQGNTIITLKGYSNAKLVTLAGSFNDWNDLHTFFRKNGDVWECAVELSPGTYTYKIVKDGEWMLDPNNASTLKDEGGYTNSVLIIK
ncbi:serine hydrolase [Rhodocytophaga rosea]|uniref:Serine hydrolase n=1 Tax=Rhodocytophaga rosea TaxID=2704465 RepID=A0A6C0GND1_9BACT|nr:serine hydrolase [Rhodocytophaga rosea]QHT69539.1 serine hydrolase [Rhodocytophaga rosea]